MYQISFIWKFPFWLRRQYVNIKQWSLLGFGTELQFQQCMRLKFDIVVYLTGVRVLWLWNHLHRRIGEISTVWWPGGQETGHLTVLPQPCRQQTSKCVRDIGWPISVTSLSCLVFVSLSRGHTRPLWHRPLPGHLQLWPSNTPISYTPTDGAIQESNSKSWAKIQATSLISCPWHPP